MKLCRIKSAKRACFEKLKSVPIPIALVHLSLKRISNRFLKTKKRDTFDKWKRWIDILNTINQQNTESGIVIYKNSISHEMHNLVNYASEIAKIPHRNIAKNVLKKENENLYLAKKCFSQITQNENMLTLYD